MGQHSAIEWTDHTFNPWWGCTKVSPGCVNCYAETWALRYGHDIWGNDKTRRFFGESHWKQPTTWNRQALDNGKRARVFCASMSDVFEDNDSLVKEREKLWEIIPETTMLDWLLLTKRPENIKKLTPFTGKWPRNVWAMATTETQEYADRRIPYLLEIDSDIKGLSIEPMLGPVDISKWINEIQWVIVGGESGAKSRPMNPDWIRSIRDVCLDAGVAFFFKQWGNWVPK
ncbi:MAG: phage Gp37/Gp68 family protein, partial [Anaerolineae bacterium]|nr:phage Gp37/Gp68 family protein [Anaerolineae bacterium]